jgi:type IV fimbrial biogenesis protein FimT
MSCRRARSLSGLTLIELLVGIALSAALMTLAAPSFRTQIAASQLTSATNALLGSLTQARAQAIRLGQRVTVCRSNDQTTCDTDRARGWETGWLVFVDATRADSADVTVSVGDTILSRNERLPGALRVTGNPQVDDYISFAASGQARTIAGGRMPLGTIRICSTSPALRNNNRARDLALATGGRVVSRDAGVVAADCS